MFASVLTLAAEGINVLVSLESFHRPGPRTRSAGSRQPSPRPRRNVAAACAPAPGHSPIVSIFLADRADLLL